MKKRWIWIILLHGLPVKFYDGKTGEWTSHGNYGDSFTSYASARKAHRKMLADLEEHRFRCVEAGLDAGAGRWAGDSANLHIRRIRLPEGGR